MDQQNTTSTRKVRFAPKAPPRRAPKPVGPPVKSEVKDENESDEAKELLRRFNESKFVPKHKIEKKEEHSAFTKRFGGPNNAYSTDKYRGNGVNASHLRKMKEYKEPWDYYSYYPVTLPLRTPYSGDPVLLDEEEFVEASESTGFDEGSTNLENDLGLEEENQETRMLFLQLPTIMPMINQSASTNNVEMSESSKSHKVAANRGKACTLKDLPAGHMGKLLVYKSGTIKLKIGDTLFDVSSGSDCSFAQDVVAINTEEKHCCILGELNKRVIVTPDVDSILNTTVDF